MMKTILRMTSSVCTIWMIVAGFNAFAQENTTFKAKALALFEQRDQPEKLAECIKILEVELPKNPDFEMNALLSRSYYLSAEYTTEKSAKLDLYDKGVKAGENALKTLDTYRKELESGKKEEEALKVLTKENLNGLYWTAANLARWAKYTSFTKKISAKSRVRYLWDRVAALDGSFFYGGVYRFFGGYYALVPSITGDQDPSKSKENFEKSLQLAPQYLETKVLYAEAYCTHAKIKDQALFRKLLQEVLAFDLSSAPELLAENKIAQAKAKKLLDEEKEFFD